jgi:hypothetical protein
MLVTATERTAVSGVALGRSCLFSLIFWLIKRLVDCCVSVNVFLVGVMLLISRLSVYDLTLPRTDSLIEMVCASSPGQCLSQVVGHRSFSLALPEYSFIMVVVLFIPE